MSSGGVGGLSRERGASQKVRHLPRNLGETKLFGGISGILPGYPGGARKVWEKMFVFIFGPL